MYSINLAYKQKTKKITLPKTIKQQDLLQLITSSFRLNQKVIGLTNSKGQLITLDQILSKPSTFEKQVLFLITTQDVNDDNMSFASDHYETKKKQLPKENKSLQIQGQIMQLPQKLEGYYQGVIGDLQLFQSLFLEEKVVTIVFCFVKEKPKNITFPYYLYHTARNSAIIYQGQTRVCQFFIQSMGHIPKEIETFAQSLGAPKVQKQTQINGSAFVKLKSKKDLNKQENMFVNQNKQKEQLFDHQIHLKSQDKQQSIEQQKFQQFNQEESSQQQAVQNNFNASYEQEEQIPEADEQQQIQASLLQNLVKLRNDEDITQLQFYKMKSELLENFSDFMRKYQMGTRKGLRRYRNQLDSQGNSPKNKKQSTQKQQRNLETRKGRHCKMTQQKEEFNNKPYTKKGLNNNFADNQRKKYAQNNQKQSRQQKKRRYFGDKEMQRNRKISQPKYLPRSAYSRQHRRTKKYEIPIIVRKYNNVIQKISTSYPLTQEQQQSINLILQLELKGLVSEKQSGIYKTCILQQDNDVFCLFLDYFDNVIDQLELVSRLKKLKKINSQNQQRSQHKMRLLIKYSKQQSYELLRNLLLDNNHLVLATFDKFKNDKNAEKLAQRLQKIANVYRQKGELEQDVLE